MGGFNNALSRVRADPASAWRASRLLVTCGETAWPPLYAVSARKNRAPGKESPLDTTSIFWTAVCWARPAHL